MTHLEGGRWLVRHSGRLAVGLLLVHAALLAQIAAVKSPTLNEPAHLVAGLSEWRFARFDLYRVNPPLVKLVAALPVLAVAHQEDWTGFPQVPVYELAARFVKQNGGRVAWLICLARWACIPFSLIGGWTCYRWAGDLYGRAAGLLACGLWCASPLVLAHASLITPDAHASALALAASYAYWGFLRRPTWGLAVRAGTLLGAALLAKTTLIVFLPLWPVLYLVDRGGASPRRGSAAGWARAIAIPAIGLYILNLGYGFHGSLQALDRCQFASRLLAVADSPRVRASVPWIGRVPSPFPRDYLLGIDEQALDFEANTSPDCYLDGEWRTTGWWYYYLYAMALKTPLAALLLAAAALLKCASAGPDDRGRPSRDEVALIVPGLAILLLVSSKVGMNLHLRYALPCLPFAFVWIGRAAASHEGKPRIAGGVARASGASRPSPGAVVVGALSLWLIVAGLRSHPDHLSYFNEFVGGPLEGARHLLNSNVDWGQDLGALEAWARAHPDRRPLFVAYHGGINPRDVGFACRSPKAGRLSLSRGDVEPGWYAISLTYLHGFPGIGVPDDRGRTEAYDLDAFREFRYLEPADWAGTSIALFHLRGAGPRDAPEYERRSREVVRRILEASRRPLPAWAALHALLPLGPSGFAERGREAFRSSLFTRVLSGPAPESPVFVRGKDGPRPLQRGDRGARQSHPDQFLHLLSMAGVPLEARVQVEGKAYTVGDVLRNSRQDAQPGQELPWTVSAYTYYLAEDARWANKFGQRLGYLDLLERLLDGENDACGGTHRLLALARALRLHASTTDLRHQRLLMRVRAELGRHAAILERSVDPQGRATLPGFDDPPRGTPERVDDDTRVVHVNGHSLEWLATARPFLNADRRWQDRLARGLVGACERQCARLERIGRPFEEGEAWDFGNLCHAGSGLVLLARETGAGSDGQGSRDIFRFDPLGPCTCDFLARECPVRQD